MKSFCLALCITLILYVNQAFGSETGMPQLNPEFWIAQIFWLILIFSILYLIIWKIFLPKITYSIENRKSRIVNDLDEAQKLKENAEKKLKEYNKIIENSNKEAKKIIDDSKKKLDKNIENKKQEFNDEIEKELVSSTRYRANLIVYFNKFSVRKLLQQRKIRFAETRSNDVLVVPVFDDGDGATLWFEPGDWRTAWLARPANEGLVPLILPLGDVMDMAAIEAAEALAPSHEALLGLAERYGTREVVVSSAFLDLPDPAVENNLDVDAAGASDASDAPVDEPTGDDELDAIGATAAAADETPPECDAETSYAVKLRAADCLQLVRALR